MLYSFFIKLLMIAVTMGVVFGIGWTVPQSRYPGADRGIAVQTKGETLQQSSDRPAGAEAPNISRPLNLQQATQVTSRPDGYTLDLNRATAREIEALPGIGPVLAERIVEYRRSRGEFSDVEQLRNVKGIGRKKFEGIRTLVHIAQGAVSRGGRKAA